VSGVATNEAGGLEGRPFFLLGIHGYTTPMLPRAEQAAIEDVPEATIPDAVQVRQVADITPGA